eukprot:m.114017 g.114017  ORF g.114017 m.114017 type:complete len:463 (+) comp14152_c0_seq1:241-1629(+)
MPDANNVQSDSPQEPLLVEDAQTAEIADHSNQGDVKEFIDIEREHTPGTETHSTTWGTIKSLIFPIYGPSSLFGFADGIVLPVIPLLARRIGCSERVVGVVAAARSIGLLLGDIPAGVLFSRLGGRGTMMWGFFGIFVGAIISAFMAIPVFLIMALIFSGFSEALVSVSRGSLIRNLVKSQFRGRAVSILGGINRVTRAVGPLIGGAISHVYGPWYSFLGRALCGLLGFLLVWRTVKAVRAVDTESGSHKGKHLHGLKHTFWTYRHQYLTGGLSAFLLMFIRMVRNVVLPLKGDDLGFSHMHIGTAFAVGYSVDALLFGPVGIAMDRYGRKSVGIPAFLIISVGLLCIPLVHSFTGLVAVSVVMGFGNGLSSGLNVTMGTDLSPKDVGTGEFMGGWHLLCDLGSLCGPLFMGFVAHATSLDTGAVMSSAVGFSGLVWYLFCVPETLHSDDDVQIVKQKTSKT